MFTVRRILPKRPRCGSHVIRSEKRRCTCRHSSRCIHESIRARMSRALPGTVLVALANPAPAIWATRPRSSGTLIRVRSSARAWLRTAGLSPTSFPISSNWFSLIRSPDSATALDTCSSAARARTRSSAWRSSGCWRAGTAAGAGDFSSAMQNYICLNPSEYDIELAAQRVANRVGNREGRVERRLKVAGRGAVYGAQIVPHVPVEYVGRGSLDEESPTTHGSSTLITIAQPVSPLLRGDVVRHGGVGHLAHQFVGDDVDRFYCVAGPIRESDGRHIRAAPAGLRSPLAIEWK